MPVVYHQSPAGLYVHGQKLLDLFNQHTPDNPIHFETIPSPPPSAFNKDGEYYEIKIDEWGTEWEHLIFGVHGHPKNYPFSSWRAAKDYRFPAMPVIDKTEIAKQREEFLVFMGWISIFEKLHALRPIDEVLVDILFKDKDLISFLDRMVDYWHKTIQLMLEAGADVIVFADDWGTQTAPIVSPSIFRDVFKPRYEELVKPIKQSGAMVFFHSCGFLGEIFDELLDLGINGLWPQIVFFEDNPVHISKCRDNGVAVYLHPDRQYLIPKGTPQAIKAKIGYYAEKYHRLGGGGIFYIEIENDAPFENVKALIESVHYYK
jgi:hypothetical protein